MKEFKYVVTDPEGIHARPAGILVKQAAGYKSAVTIVKGEKSADAKRIFGVMGLGVKTGEEVTIKVDGEDEETATAESTPPLNPKTTLFFITVLLLVYYIKNKIKVKH